LNDGLSKVAEELPPTPLGLGGLRTLSSMSCRRRVNEFIPMRVAESGRVSSTRRPEAVSFTYLIGDAWNSAHLPEMFLTKPRRKGVDPPGVITAGVLSPSASARC